MERHPSPAQPCRKRLGPQRDRTAAPSPGRLRLRRRWRRGRGNARAQRGRVLAPRVSPPGAARRQRHRRLRRTAGTPARVSARARPHRFHPHRRSAGRARGGPRCSTGRYPVLALDPEHQVDRGGGRRGRRPPLVPGVHVEGPRPGQGDDRPLQDVGLRGDHPDGRHGGAGTPGAGRAPRLHAAPQDRARDDRRRHPAPGVDLGVREIRTHHVRQRRRPQRG